jgi:hypothetical protein
VTYRAAVAVPHTSNRLLLALLLGSTGLIGGATLLNSSIMSADAAVAPAIAAVTPTTVSHGKHSSPKTKAHGPRVHPSDLAAIDFRTLGACECPPLPERAPKWLQQLAADDGFQYRDIAHLLDTRGHFLFDALSGEKRLSELYYFSEKVVSWQNSLAFAHCICIALRNPRAMAYVLVTVGCFVFASCCLAFEPHLAQACMRGLSLGRSPLLRSGSDLRL